MRHVEVAIGSAPTACRSGDLPSSRRTLMSLSITLSNTFRGASNPLNAAQDIAIRTDLSQWLRLGRIALTAPEEHHTVCQLMRFKQLFIYPSS